MLVAGALGALALFVWRANRLARVNKLFALQSVLIAMWTLSVAVLQTGSNLELWARSSFIVSSFIPPCSLAFIKAYPAPADALSRGFLRLTLAAGAAFAILAAF